MKGMSKIHPDKVSKELIMMKNLNFIFIPFL